MKRQLTRRLVAAVVSLLVCVPAGVAAASAVSVRSTAPMEPGIRVARIDARESASAQSGNELLVVVKRRAASTPCSPASTGTDFQALQDLDRRVPRG